MTTSVAVSGPCLPGPNLSDETDLVARLRAGDEDAYEALFRAHSGALLAVARRFLGDTDDAADAVQDAFVSAFRALGSFEGGARLGTWLHRIAVNACLMKLRGRKRSRLVPLDESHAPACRSEDDHLGRAEVADRVWACIDRLPPAYRAVIRLRDIEGVGTAEAAGRLGTNEGAVKVRLHRARQALKALLVAAVVAW
ncbi:MAG TPA: sigma-70 family RNA polymerase sigma factor [Gemmataceae bacterium]|nr:sigma-70 family RNA polymerase sigma factor [Gemmataceae bacterium]